MSRTAKMTPVPKRSGGYRHAHRNHRSGNESDQPSQSYGSNAGLTSGGLPTPDELKSMVEGLGTRASAGTPRISATFGDVVMLTIPLKAVPESCGRSCAGARWKNRARHGKWVQATGRSGCAPRVRASAGFRRMGSRDVSRQSVGEGIQHRVPRRRCRPRRIAKAIGSASRSPAMMRRRSIPQRRWCAMRDSIPSSSVRLLVGRTSSLTRSRTTPE